MKTKEQLTDLLNSKKRLKPTLIAKCLLRCDVSVYDDLQITICQAEINLLELILSDNPIKLTK